MLLLLHINRGKKSCMKGNLMALQEAVLGMPFFLEKIILQSPMYFYLALELTSYVARILKDF